MTSYEAGKLVGLITAMLLGAIVVFVIYKFFKKK